MKLACSYKAGPAFGHSDQCDCTGWQTWGWRHWLLPLSSAPFPGCCNLWDMAWAFFLMPFFPPSPPSLAIPGCSCFPFSPPSYPTMFSPQLLPLPEHSHLPHTAQRGWNGCLVWKALAAARAQLPVSYHSPGLWQPAWHGVGASSREPSFSIEAPIPLYAGYSSPSKLIKDSTY